MIREILKTGEWSGGTVTRKIIKDVINNFSSNDRAPIIKGHTVAELENIRDDAKNQGWVKRIWTDNTLSTAIAKLELNREGKQAYFSEGFENCSVGLRQNSRGQWYLHHLGLLSALPPSIKDLKVLEYGDKKRGIIVQAGDASLEIIYTGRESKKYFVDNDSNSDKESEMEEKTGAVIAQMAEEKEQLKQKNAELEKRLEALEKGQTAEQQQTAQKLQEYEKRELETRKEQLRQAAAGRIPKKQLEELLNFADSGEKDIFPLLTGIFSGMGRKVEAGEMNMGDLPGAGEEVDLDINEYIMNV